MYKHTHYYNPNKKAETTTNAISSAGKIQSAYLNAEEAKQGGKQEGSSPSKTRKFASWHTSQYLSISTNTVTILFTNSIPLQWKGEHAIYLQYGGQH